MSLTVAEVMSRQVQTVEPPTSCLAAWELMRRTGVDHVAVVSRSGRVHGAVSREDMAIAWFEHGEASLRETLGERLLGRSQPRVHSETPVSLAAQVMLDSGSSVVPVLGPGQVLIGVVAVRDMLAAVADCGLGGEAAGTSRATSSAGAGLTPV